MATTKKAVKKAAPRKARPVKLPPERKYISVISERSKLFMWTPVEAYNDPIAANEARRRYEEDSIYGGSGYKVTRVPVQG